MVEMQLGITIHEPGGKVYMKRKEFDYMKYKNVKLTKIKAKKIYKIFIDYCKTSEQIAYKKYSENIISCLKA